MTNRRKTIVWATLFALLLAIHTIPQGQASTNTYYFNADGNGGTATFNGNSYDDLVTSFPSTTDNFRFNIGSGGHTTFSWGIVLLIHGTNGSTTTFAGSSSAPLAVTTGNIADLTGTPALYSGTTTPPAQHFITGDVLLVDLYDRFDSGAWSRLTGGWLTGPDKWLRSTTWTVQYYTKIAAGDVGFSEIHGTTATSQIQNIRFEPTKNDAVSCDFSWSPTPVYKGNATTFTATTNATTPHYSWSWSDGTSNSTSNPITHTFNVIGVANVTLIVNDTSTGVTCTAVHQVTILTPPPPNTVITPSCFNIAPWLFFISGFLTIASFAATGWNFVHLNIRGGVFAVLALIVSLSLLYVSVFVVSGC